MDTIQSVRGTKDTLPADMSKWHAIESAIRGVAWQFGYDELRTPVFEKTEVFARGVGGSTDIVNKEMYTFADRGGEQLTLRPEQTAALVRAVIQNNLLEGGGFGRFFYIGSYFRYERPQKGRLREFHQYGAELLGSPHPEADVEVILLAACFLRRLGITGYTLKLNSLGSDESRAAYRQALVGFLSANKADLSAESQARMAANPLRVLDSKAAGDVEIVSQAPSILDYLDAGSREHFASVQRLLAGQGIAYEVVPTLVRGLDYYSHTVFEFQSTCLGAQDSFGGGGRYNGLFAELGGGAAVPAVGFAMGLERLILILEQLGISFAGRRVDVSVVLASEAQLSFGLKVAQAVRSSRSELCVVMDIGRRSMKAQLREANRQLARWAFIIGEAEEASSAVTIKYMQEEKAQETVLLADIEQWLSANC